MKKLYCIALSIILIGCLKAEDESQKTMLISFSKRGFFSCFFAVLSNVAWCEKNNVRPVVCWGNKSLYYQKGAYRGTYEPWEYYFEPIAGITANEAKSLENKFIFSKYWAPDYSKVPTTRTLSQAYGKTLRKDYRKEMHDIITRYVKIKPYITDKVDEFCNEHMLDKVTIGIHIRGTDKTKETRPVSVKQMCAAAITFAAPFTDAQFFIATDDARKLEEAKKYLNEPIISYDSFRSINGKPIHIKNKGYNHNRAHLGEEVLIEALLLSRCNKFVHTRSNVSSAVLFFNPELENILISGPKRSSR